MPADHNLRTLAAAITGAVAISFSAIYFALSDVSPITGSVFRMAYATPILFVIWLVGRSRDRRPRSRRWLAFGVGFLLAVDIVLWHASINYIGAGLATLLANSQVLWVAFGAWAIQGEKPSRRTMFAVPVVLAGVALVSGIGQSAAFGSNPVLGAGMALVAAVFYSAFILGYRASNQSFAPPAGPLLEASIGALIGSLVLALIPQASLDITFVWPNHGWLLATAMTGQVFGWLLVGYALPRLPAVETATIILLQPVLTMVWGALIFDERPSPLQMLGAVVVLGGVGFVAVTRSRREPAEQAIVRPSG